VAIPVLGHEDAGEVGVIGERDAEHVVHLALHRLGAGIQVEQRGDGGVVGGHLHAQPDALAPFEAQQVDDHLEAFGCDIVRQGTRRKAR
jgi:hypothetical protein